MNKKNAIILGTTCLFIAALAVGLYGYKIYSKVKSYDSYIYPGVVIENEDVSGKTQEEVEKILNDKYQASLQNKKVSIKVESKNYTIAYSQIGAKYDINKAIKEAYNYGKDGSIMDRYKLLKNPISKNIKLSFAYSSNTKPIDDVINNIKNDINKDPKNASITKNGGSFIINPDQDGYKLKDQELKKNIISAINGQIGEEPVVHGNIETVKAGVTKEKLSGINTFISTFSTSYGSISSPGRMTNIQLATKTINGKVVMPGETFSFNGILGRRTTEKGYQSAPVDIGKTTGMGIGGGICQVSTTLYNAALLAGIKPTVRTHHSIPSAYVSLGHDATVDYDGKLDYQFKNTFNFPIYIEGSSANGIETFNIYSDASLKSKTYKVVDDVLEGGKRVKLYLQTYQNGTMISNELISNDSY
ncbi:VanW family protein [Clostridium guangxiense]|uniref:VanW family protein n=1 Tax=Clostridium guangxiense TaxID=1662055 RepID=UPI001E35CBC2|nr:VanW family protein [Clostridium guangxiense]MCD2347559.1 VanW family protein [Clostridium guangxiense]